eukprot:6752847-Pyramimonas_sp.AAC.1
MLSSPPRLVPTSGMCSPLRRDWSPPQEYALLSAAIGPHLRDMLTSPPRLVPTSGICSPLRRVGDPARNRVPRFVLLLATARAKPFLT